jgi:uncharacterized repeat protein (TIGR04052 family)
MFITLLSVSALGAVGCGDDDDDSEVHDDHDHDASSEGQSGAGGSARGGSGGSQHRAGSGGSSNTGGRSGSSASGTAGKAAAGAGGTAAGGSGKSAQLAGRGGSVAAGGGGSSGASADGISVTVRFQAKVGNEDFACGRDYQNIGKGKHTATPQDFRFFVQEVRLLKDDGTEVPLVFDERESVQTKDVALIDFTDDSGLCGGFGNLTNTEITGKAPAGEYTGITFVNGVPDALNHQNLTMAKPPLQDTSTFWGWQSGYRFSMNEIARKDAAGSAEATSTDDAGLPPDPVSLIHIGSSACTGSVAAGYTCGRPGRNHVRITGFDPTKKAVVADFAKVFEGIDLGVGAQCHGYGAECKPMFDAYGVNISNGEPLETQSVFRAE